MIQPIRGTNAMASFIQNFNDDEASGENESVPSLEHDLRRAKMFLQEHSSESGDSLYDHITELFEKILSERPKNAVDIFEEYSKKIKDKRFETKTNYLRDQYISPAQCENAKKYIKLYQALRSKTLNKEEEEEDGTGDDEKNDDPKRRSPDMLDLLFYLEHIDVALSRSEIVTLNLSIRKLVAEKPIENARFWGKILGKPKNYYVVEAEFIKEELIARRSAGTEAEERRKEIESIANSKEEESERKEIENDPQITESRTNTTINENAEMNESRSSKKLHLVFPPMPENLWRAESTIVPAEEIGFGLNKNIYYVCNSPGIDDWIELPSITPQQIVSARQIIRVLTGDPESSIYTFPSFPGTEKNYLRAQIARITAATLVSPIGFFTFGGGTDDDDDDDDDEEEEDESEATEFSGEDDEADSRTISENQHYDPLPLKELIDPTMANWCHHRPYILPQGRTVRWDPKKANSNGIDDIIGDDSDEEEEDKDEEEKEDENENEEQEGKRVDASEFRNQVGPPLLTPLSEDATIESIGAWTARASTTITSDNTAIAIVRSNIWPGSFAFARGKRFANVYIGTGQKFSPYNYSPPGMPMIQDQYKIGPEVAEIQEPSIEVEEAYRIAQLLATVKPRSLQLGEGENESSESLDEREEEEEEEEEEEDEDGDD